MNPAAAGGKALKALPTVHATLDSLGAEHRTVTTRSIDHAFEEAGRAVEAGETVVALGGDGLLRPLAGALKGTDSALAIVPGGRGNDFARVLGIPKDPAEAARIAVPGRGAARGRGQRGGHALHGHRELRLRLRVQPHRERGEAHQGQRRLPVRRHRACWRAWKPATFKVTVDDDRRDFTGYSVAVGNSTTYGGGMRILPEAQLDDGKLDVILTSDGPRHTFISGVVKTFKAKHVDSPLVEFLRGEEIEVSSDRPFVIYADGDPIGATPAIIRVERRCLRVIAPA